MRNTIYQSLHMGLDGNSNRSSKRTDVLHENLVSQIKTLIPNFDELYEIKYESKISDWYGGTFTIDILVLNKVTKEIYCCVLVKSIISSFNKNRQNYTNTTIGETLRVAGKHPNSKILFVTLCPNSCPTFDGKRNLKSIEKPNLINISNLNYPDNLSALKTNVFHSYIRYDIENVDYSTKNAFYESLTEESIVNIEDSTFTDYVNKIF